MHGDDSIVGTILASRYVLRAELARGSMGDVYRARDLDEDRDVAVKVLRAEHRVDHSMRRRFRREAAVLKALSHPAIVPLLDLEVDEEGAVFMVTEYVEGPTLAERIAEAPLDLPSADRLIEAMCGALGAAHAHGVLHGDLKPSNVLWVSPLPQLVDFGASKVLGLDRLTATGQVAGTPAYMAPEVLTGKGDVDERIDVYGLGVLLYEALGGRPPFSDAHVGRLLMKIDAGDCLPLDAVADVPRELASIVGRAMAPDPEARFEGVDALARAWSHRQ